jgi:peptidoglycan/LPS O-acetylase OafA/YrhL
MAAFLTTPARSGGDPSRSAPPPLSSGGSTAGEIGALTSLRWFAAVWVVLFHLQALSGTFLGPVFTLLGPLAGNGDMGVDVFFILSGFILCWTYLDRLGPRLSIPGSVAFLWARFARMWPAFVLTTGVLGLWLLYGSRHHSLLDWSLQLDAPDFSPWGLAKQLLMVHLWFQPVADGASWFGPGWTVSAEWLAYLCFPLLSLGLYRLRRVPAAVSLAGAVLILLPVALVGPGQLVDTHGQYPYDWLVRIGCCFLSGGLAFLGVRQLRESAVFASCAGPAAAMLAAAGVLFLFLTRSSDAAKLLVLSFPLLIAALSLARGRVRTALNVPWLLHGGRISYSLYLVHMFFIYVFHRLSTDWLPAGDAAGINSLALACLLAIPVSAELLYRLVEEPARRSLRRLDPMRGRSTSGAQRPGKGTSLNTPSQTARVPASPMIARSATDPTLTSTPATSPRTVTAR